jgi:hypothetical protein
MVKIGNFVQISGSVTKELVPLSSPELPRRYLTVPGRYLLKILNVDTARRRTKDAAAGLSASSSSVGSKLVSE